MAIRSVRASVRASSAESAAYWQPLGPVGGYLRTSEAARYLRISASTLTKLRCKGGGPRYFRPAGTRICLYNPADLGEWLGSPRVSTSEPSP